MKLNTPDSRTRGQLMSVRELAPERHERTTGARFEFSRTLAEPVGPPEDTPSVRDGTMRASGSKPPNSSRGVWGRNGRIASPDCVG